MDIVGSGIGQTTGTVEVGSHTGAIKVRVASGSTATIKFGNIYSVKVASLLLYETIPGDYPTFEVTAGTIDWIALG